MGPMNQTFEEGVAAVGKTDVLQDAHVDDATFLTVVDGRKGIFGKAYAGYGYDADTETEAKNKYMVGGNVNFFSGSSRLSLIGLFNL